MLSHTWEQSTIDVYVDDGVKIHRLNGKFAFTKGPFVLAADKRLEPDLARPRRLKTQKSGLKAKKIVNTAFHSNIALEIPLAEGKLIVYDYAEAGKNYDEENSGVSVWFSER